MKHLGGYFELELRNGRQYHPYAIKLNTGRNALEYILISKEYKKLYLPFYTCDVLLQPLNRLGIEYQFYHINEHFEPIFNFSIIKSNESFLYTNYFGLLDNKVHMISKLCPNLIIDNSQAFFTKPLSNTDTFYSARKFFGLPDGAYLYSDKHITQRIKFDISFNRFQHLLQRIDIGPEEAFELFKKNEQELTDLPIMYMSKLTKAILCGIDYKSVIKNRQSNFNILNNELGSENRLKFNIDRQVPLVYPFLPKKPFPKGLLVKNKIFVATYWENVIKWVGKSSFEYVLASELINLPLDQRLNKNDMMKIINVVKKHYASFH